MSLAVAAGNAYNAAYGDAFGGKALASNPDYGLVSEPSTYGESLSVAAVSNGMVKGPYVTVGGKNLAYQDSATISEDENAKPFRSLSARGSIEYVVVPNYGAEEDYAGLDLTGKIALVQRGGGMYYEQKGAQRRQRRRHWHAGVQQRPRHAVHVHHRLEDPLRVYLPGRR